MYSIMECAQEPYEADTIILLSFTNEKQLSHLPKVMLLASTFNHHWALSIEQCQGHYTRLILPQV